MDSAHDIKIESQVLLANSQGSKITVMGNYRSHMATGRVAMFNPNLLGIDKDSSIKIGNKKKILSLKKAFEAKAGYCLVTADYCQIELRILTALSDEKSLIDVFNQDIDPFKLIAARIKRKENVDEITEYERNSAKQVC